MKTRFLEVTFREGRALAAYLYLTDDHDRKSHRSEKSASGLILDYGVADELIGIEIVSPSRATLEKINDVLLSHGQPLLADDELSPLMAA